jgi:hypothetical protein
VAEKQFLGKAACRDLAAAAAVVIATWEGELAGAARLTLRTLPPEARQTTPAVHPWVWRFGAVAGLSLAGSGVDPGVWLDASVGRGSGLQGALTAFVEGTHERALGGGEGQWQRNGLGLGPRWLWQGQRWLLGIDALAYGAYMRLAGQGLPTVLKDQAWDVGTLGSIRVGWQVRAVTPLLAAGVSQSFVRRTLVAEPGGETPMPATSLWLMAGLSWRVSIFPKK